tara:strand:+ start:9620 stop:10066 length:447 start_codon:yes stop_codon:yes gene_type:complete
MPIRKTDDRSNESNSKYTKSKTTSKSENIDERFDDTTHNDNPYDDALQYLSKKIDDIIDETNIGTLASGSYAGDIKILKVASGSFSTRVTTNDAKTTSTFPAVTSTVKGVKGVVISDLTHTGTQLVIALTVNLSNGRQEFQSFSIAVD